MSRQQHSIDELRDIVNRLPTTRNEDWKYTDLATARDISSRWLAAGRETLPLQLRDEVEAITGAVDANWIVIANGELQDPVDIEGASRLEVAPSPGSALAELNAALLKDGLRLHVDGELDRPIGILLIDGTEDTSVTQAYVEIEFAPGASGEIIEYHASKGNADQYANTIVSVAVGDAASARHLRVQNRAAAHIQTGRTSVSVGRDSVYTMSGFDLGGSLVRNDIIIDLSAPGADVSFDGLYLAGEGQHIDNHTRVDHRVGPAQSRQEYRGILNGKCRCVWNGKAIVHEGADGTDADQANHNLLLSEKAEIDAKPELEIYADDVKCSHGTTVGQLDEASLFYLRTRGLDKRHATQVLTHAFAADLVARMPIEAAKDALSSVVEQRLAELLDSDPEAFS